MCETDCKTCQRRAGKIKCKCCKSYKLPEYFKKNKNDTLSKSCLKCQKKYRELYHKRKAQNDHLLSTK